MSSNVPLYSDLCADCSCSGGNSKTLFLELKNQKNINVPVVPPLSLLKSIEKNDVKMGNLEIKKNENKISNSNIREKGGQTGTDSSPELPDSRFKNPNFRAAVKVVLEFLSEEQNFASFKRYDRQYGSKFPIDWIEFAENINNPRFVAKCYVLWGNKTFGLGRVITSSGALKISVKLFGATKDEAILGLDTKKYEFIKWESEYV